MIESGNNYFRTLSLKKLIHITTSKAEIYNLSIDNTHPPKMVIKDVDSIYIPSLPYGYEFVDLVNIMNDDFIVVFQTKS